MKVERQAAGACRLRASAVVSLAIDSRAHLTPQTPNLDDGGKK